jgi:hypothetical protein
MLDEKRDDLKTIAIEELALVTILTFCENLAELGCPREAEDSDMWFRYLKHDEQYKVAEKLVDMILENNKRREA